MFLSNQQMPKYNTKIDYSLHSASTVCQHPQNVHEFNFHYFAHVVFIINLLV